MHVSTKCRQEAIKKITKKHYEPGNLTKCYKNIWRFYVLPIYGISYRTYLNYLKA